MNFPEDRKYLKTHEWVQVEGSMVTLGITDYAQDSLGDIVFIEVPELGAELEKGDEITTIESVKAASPIYTPVAGTIKEVNSELEDTPEKINQDAYGTFIVKIEASGDIDEGDFLDSSGYEAVVEEEKS
jgi:glycine cleavage system H protein